MLLLFYFTVQNEIFAKPSVARPERRRITADCRYRQRPQNLQGAPGKGYSLQLDIGTPPQQVRETVKSKDLNVGEGWLAVVDGLAGS